MKKVLKFLALPVLKNFRLIRCLLTLFLIPLLIFIMTSFNVSPFVTSSILTAKAYTTEYDSNYTRIIQPSQFVAEGNWRQNSFSVSLPYHPYPPFYLSFYAVDLYGERLEKWVSFTMIATTLSIVQVGLIILNLFLYVTLGARLNHM